MPKRFSGPSSSTEELRPLKKDELDAFQTENLSALIRFASNCLAFKLDANDPTTPNAPDECVHKVLYRQRDRIREGRPSLIASGKHLKNLIYRAVRRKCGDLVKAAKRRAELANEDIVRDALAPIPLDDVEEMVHVKELIDQAKSLPGREPLVFAFLLKGLSVAAIAKKLRVDVSTVNRDIEALKVFIKANLGVLFAWLGRRKSLMIVGGAAVLSAARLPLPPPNDSGCYTNKGAPVVLANFLNAEHNHGADWTIRLCKRE